MSPYLGISLGKKDEGIFRIYFEKEQDIIRTQILNIGHSYPLGRYKRSYQQLPVASEVPARRHHFQPVSESFD